MRKKICFICIKFMIKMREREIEREIERERMKKSTEYLLSLRPIYNLIGLGGESLPKS